LAPKVREFFEYRFFGEQVDLENPQVVSFHGQRGGTPPHGADLAAALQAVAISTAEPTVTAPARPLSTCPPFPWSQLFLEARKTVFNLVAATMSTSVRLPDS